MVNPAKLNIFYVETRSNPLDKDMKDHYQLISVNLLWIMNISILDIDTEVSFISTRIQEVTEDNC